MAGWQIYSAKDYKEKLLAYEQAKAAAEAANPPVQIAAETPGVAPSPAVANAPAATPQPAQITSGQPMLQPALTEESAAEDLFVVKTAAAEYAFTNLGGGIHHVDLYAHLHDKDGGAPVRINSAARSAIGAISEVPGDAAQAPFTRVNTGEGGKVRYERVTPAGLQIAKTYSVNLGEGQENEYRCTVEIELKNTGGVAAQSPGLYLSLGSASPIHSKDQPRYIGLEWQGEGSKFIDTQWFKSSKVPLLGFETRGARSTYQQQTSSLAWAAVKSQYFSTLATFAAPESATLWARPFEVRFPDEENPMSGIESSVGLAGFTLPAGEAKTFAFELYTGPNQYSRLTKLGGTQDKVLKYGMFKFFSLTLLKALNWIHSFVGNYGIAILILTLVIKSMLWPLQNKATKSMRRMSALAPKMTELKEKYKDDPTRMNQEVMKLYKDYGVNPFGGCLPMVVQIPIFFGFYSMLGTAVELRNSPFLWVGDLSQPDTVFHILQLPINILPLLMAGTMLWQMSLTPKTGDAVQQRMFMFMPLIFVVFCYNYASALALYWTAQNLFTVVQLYLTRNQAVEPLKRVEAPSLPAGMGNKVKSQGKRTTKPKG